MKDIQIYENYYPGMTRRVFVVNGILKRFTNRKKKQGY